VSDDLDLLVGRRDIIAAGAALALLGPQSAARAAMAGPAELAIGRDQPFDLGWRFLRGSATEFEAPALDDSGWRVVDLPHDWSIEDVPGDPQPGKIGPFEKSAVGGTGSGFTVGGEGWYRKHFRLTDLPAGARVEIQFEGIYVVSDVWMNGHWVGNHVHGYTPFAFDLTPYVTRGGDNLIAVRVRNVGNNARWYSGSGIYRPVTIDVLRGPGRIARWGVGAWTRHIDDRGAEIDVATRLEDVGASMTLRTRLRDKSGAVVAETSSTAGAEIRQTLNISKPKLWSPTSPELYSLESALLQGTAIVDTIVQPFGARIVTMDAEHGLRINGESFKLRGGCVHHDNGLLGATAFADADERRILLLKARGFNAIRSSHNPCSSSFRHACDRYGMLLIEEAFDSWHVPKWPDDYSTNFKDHWQGDLDAMVLSARNSPSVIMWSIGNEIPERMSDEGLEISWRLANEVHRLDPTRPVTAAIHAFPGRPLIAGEKTARRGLGGVAEPAATMFLDVVGYNYKFGDFERDHPLYPQRVFYGSETFPSDAHEYRELCLRAPYVLGEFIWTAMDYIGEAGIGLGTVVPSNSPPYSAIDFPVVISYCGDVDLIGNQKPQSRFRDVVWGVSTLEVAVQRPVPDGMKERVAQWGWRDELQSWTWPDMTGQSLKVHIYTSGDRIELKVNGKSLGSRNLTAADKMHTEIATTYEPGTLEVIAYRMGVEIARRHLTTASAPAQLQVTPEVAAGLSDRHALNYVRVAVLDAAGQLVPEAMPTVQLTITGPAELVGFGTANPRAVGSYQANIARTFEGRALAILRSRGRPGTVRISASSAGLHSGSTTIRLQ
jgi:beta-galactosidase